MDESILFSLGSLSKFFLEALSESWVVGYIYSRVRGNVKRYILPNRVFWWLDLATGLSREFKRRENSLASWNFCHVVNSWHDASASGMLGTCAPILRLAVASHLRNPPASPCFFART